MSLYAEGGVWIILSKVPYDNKWVAGLAYSGSEKAYDLLSYLWPPDMYEYDFDPKEIH